jgi:hypothetical protein
MTIWLLALVLLTSLAALGYRQGAIRVGFSFFGILFGAVLAVPLGRLLGRVVGLLGIKDPFLVWALGPVIVFILFSIIFKVAAAAVHHKVEVYYKYHAGDLRLALWERLNRRLGLCLGSLNGAAYLVLLAFLIYVPSYFTVQIASSDTDPKWMRFLNLLGRDLHSTGFVKVARSIDSIPQIDYDMADFAALLYHNPLVEARLSNYPAFLALGDQPAFQALGNDKEFTESWQRSDPVMNLVNHPTFEAIRNDPDLLKTIWDDTAPNLMDLRTYLVTGESPKFDPEKILGRWTFDVNAAVIAMRRLKPNMFSTEMQRVRKYLETSFSKSSFVARPDNQVVLRNVPSLQAAPAAMGNMAPGAGPAVVSPALQTMQGQWKEAGAKYVLSISGQELPATVEGDRLKIASQNMELVFSRED